MTICLKGMNLIDELEEVTNDQDRARDIANLALRTS
jgi:hypothetical protein